MLRRGLQCAVIVAALWGAGCSKMDILNATIPEFGYDVVKDVAYAPHPRKMLDIYIPHDAKNAAVLVFFYGGSWQHGSKEDYRFIGEAFAGMGYVTVIADYRLYPEVVYPDFVRDGAQAVTYVRRHIRHYHGDPSHIYVMGHSAGAFIAQTLAVDPTFMTQAGGKRSWIRGAIGIAGPYNFLPITDEKLQTIFGAQPHAQAMPVNRAKAPIPPVFLATGDADDTVDPRNSAQLAERLEAFGAKVTRRNYKGVGHIGIILSLAHGFRDRIELREEIAAFIEANR